MASSYKVLVRPEHMNHQNHLFGGYMLLWVDEYAYLAALDDFPTMKFVTRGLEAVSFTRGVECGTVLTFNVSRFHTGRTSVTYKVEVDGRKDGSLEEYRVFSTCITFCAVDEAGRKTPLPAPVRW